ncbi:hypothetical protein VTK73DRAFT_3918 [Phialemonium thermophilum]|uniref:Sulfhydryl oxidase n=1 Tax=Phialemonium thermophilum TaxID=223376 RepID=A0ABR3WWP5_9PEZI
MAEDTREQSSSNPSVAPATGGGPSETNPVNAAKGVVLGKDGKPCRPCSSFAAFTKSTLKKPSQPATTTATLTTPGDCPADVETLGRSSWTLLHTIAATYPTSPSPSEQSDLKSFIKLFSKLYPCWVCAEDFQHYIKKQDVRTDNRQAFGTWLCEAHNEVNRKLGKPIFDCSKWEERWRTGWKDGRCD